MGVTEMPEEMHQGQSSFKNGEAWAKGGPEEIDNMMGILDTFFDSSNKENLTVLNTIFQLVNLMENKEEDLPLHLLQFQITLLQMICLIDCKDFELKPLLVS